MYFIHGLLASEFKNYEYFCTLSGIHTVVIYVHIMLLICL